MKQYFLISSVFCVTTIFGGGNLSILKKATQETNSQLDTMTEENYQKAKTRLSKGLNDFLEDFGQWDDADKDKIKIIKLSMFINGDLTHKAASYNDSIGLWIDSRTRTQQRRIDFMGCLQYLKQVKN